MPNALLDRLDSFGSSVKALTVDLTGDVPFYITSSDSGGVYGNSSPGSGMNFRALAGDLLENGVVATCVNTRATAMASAPAVVEKLQGEKWVKTSDHPLAHLINNPNPQYGAAQLWNSLDGDECTSGHGFWRVIWNEGGTEPVELWWLPQSAVIWPWGSIEELDKYKVRLFENQEQVQINRPAEKDVWSAAYVADRLQSNKDWNGDECLIQFRWMLDRYDPRRGWTPLYAMLRQVFGDNATASYMAAILRNPAITNTLFKLASQAADEASQFTEAQFKQAVDRVVRMSSGEAVNSPAYTNLPIDTVKVGMTPDELAIPNLADYYESRVSSVLGVNPMVSNLGAGGTQKTYSNFKESLIDFWQRTVVPTQDRRAGVMRSQLVPLFGDDPKTTRVNFDYSNVPAMIESELSKHSIYLADFAGGGIDRETFKVRTGYDATPEDKDVYVKPAVAANTEQDADALADPTNADPAAVEDDDETKSFKSGYNPNQPRDHGEWTSGGAGLNAAHTTGDADFQATGSRYGKWRGNIEDFPKAFVDSDMENAVAYDKNGKQIFHVIGTANSVYIPAEQQASLVDANILHNHPHGVLGVPVEALTPSDIKTAARLNLKSLIVVTRIAGKPRVVVLERTSRWNLSGDRVLEIKYHEGLMQGRTELTSQVSALVKKGDVEEARAVAANARYFETLSAMKFLANYYGSFTVKEVL